MGAVSLTGSDVVCINGRVFHDFADGKVASLSFEGDLVTVTPSKNGNVIYALNASGNLSKLELRLLLGSSDDRYVNALLASQMRDLSATVLAVGSFVKRVTGWPGPLMRGDSMR